MILNPLLGIVLIWLATIAAVFVVFGYFIIRKREVAFYVGAFVVSAGLTLGCRIAFTTTVIEYTSEYEYEKHMCLFIDYYKGTDMQQVPLNAPGYLLIINASNADLVYVPIIYGDMDDDYYVEDLPAHTHLFTKHAVNYDPDHTPPDEIRTKRSGEVKYWLTTPEKYLEKYPEAEEGEEEYYGK